MENSLRIVLWNANGLSNHKLELQNVLQIHKVDIASIKEAHFTIRTMFKIPYYKVYHILHPDDNAHGGAAVIIQSAITHRELLHKQLDKIHAANIQADANPCTFTISMIYCPPRYATSAEEYIAFFQSLGSKFLTSGEWNAKHKEWGVRLITPRGRSPLHATNRQDY
jgi:exonuclease III